MIIPWSSTPGNRNNASVVFSGHGEAAMDEVRSVIGDRLNYIVYSAEAGRWFITTKENQSKRDIFDLSLTIRGEVDLYFYDLVSIDMGSLVGELVHRMPDYSIRNGAVIEQ